MKKNLIYFYVLSDAARKMEWGDGRGCRVGGFSIHTNATCVMTRHKHTHTLAHSHALEVKEVPRCVYVIIFFLIYIFVSAPGLPYSC